jgi:hypothetical protein
VGIDAVSTHSLVEFLFRIVGGTIMATRYGVSSGSRREQRLVNQEALSWSGETMFETARQKMQKW